MTLFSLRAWSRFFLFAGVLACSLLGSGCSSFSSTPKPPIQKAVVLPILTLHKELRRDVAIVQNQLIESLEDAGYDCIVIAPDEFARLQTRAFEESGSIYNPSIGEFVALDPNKYLASLFQQLYVRGKFDVLITPELTLRAARINGTQIAWDGVVREMEVRGNSKYLTPREARGLSLLISMYGSRGNPVGRGIGGISVPFYLDARTSDVKFELRDVFFNADEVAEGVNEAVKAFRRR